MIAVHESVTSEGRAIDVRVEDGIDVRILPDRGFDLGDAWFRGRRIAWLSPLGETRWRGEFARSFGGGLVVTCGLRNVGVPSEGQPQHGWYSSLPAAEVRVDQHEDRVVARARVIEADVPGATLELEREIVVDGGVHITDVTRNRGPEPEVAPLLYHCNLLWDAVEIDSDGVLPRDEDAAAGDWRELGSPGPERVYEHVRARRIRVRNGSNFVLINTNLPRLWQWIHPSYGVIGVEPANCSVLGRAHDRAEGRLPILEPGEERETSITIRVEVT
jgi:Domain of unknown function (DUF4432)